LLAELKVDAKLYIGQFTSSVNAALTGFIGTNFVEYKYGYERMVGSSL